MPAMQYGAMANHRGCISQERQLEEVLLAYGFCFGPLALPWLPLAMGALGSEKPLVCVMIAYACFEGLGSKFCKNLLEK